jgi:hypothetical protein
VRSEVLTKSGMEITDSGCCVVWCVFWSCDSTHLRAFGKFQTLWRNISEDSHLWYLCCALKIHLKYQQHRLMSLGILSTCKCNRMHGYYALDVTHADLTVQLICIVSDYRLGDWGSIAGKTKYFSSSLCVQISSEAHPSSYTVGTGDHSQG